jgi:hypothetical protein
VMIPTLLMNIPNTPNQTTTQTTILVCEWLWFFSCEFSFLLFLSYFICSSIAAWETEQGCGIHKNGNRSGRKALLGGGHQQLHRRRKKSG